MITSYTFLSAWVRAHTTERGASLVEYALLVALIAVVCIAAITTLRSFEQVHHRWRFDRRRELSRDPAAATAQCEPLVAAPVMWTSHVAYSAA